MAQQVEFVEGDATEPAGLTESWKVLLDAAGYIRDLSSRREWVARDCRAWYGAAAQGTAL